MKEEQYDAFLTRADSAMSAHQDRLQREFRLGQWPRFDYDEGAGVIVFSQQDTARVVADVQFVGEVGRRDSTFWWAWDLPALRGFDGAARSARRYGWLHGVHQLHESGWHGDDVDGWEMTSITGWIAGAEGAYRAPSSDSARYTFMLLRNVRWAPPGRLVRSYIVSRRAD